MPDDTSEIEIAHDNLRLIVPDDTSSAIEITHDYDLVPEDTSSVIVRIPGIEWS